MAETLNVAIRPTRGTSRARRDRAAGRVPAVLYGHGKENVSLTIPAEEIHAAVRHGTHFVQLAGDVNDSALIREVQWDTYGTQVLHVDLTRVEEGESVVMSVSVELRGVAPGTKQGGIVKLLVHDVKVECPVVAIPDKLILNVNSLELDQSLTAASLELPAGTKLLTDPNFVVAQCVMPLVVEEEVAAVPAGAAEPELIGRKPEEEAEEEEASK